MWCLNIAGLHPLFGLSLSFIFNFTISLFHNVGFDFQKLLSNLRSTVCESVWTRHTHELRKSSGFYQIWKKQPAETHETRNGRFSAAIISLIKTEAQTSVSSRKHTAATRLVAMTTPHKRLMKSEALQSADEPRRWKVTGVPAAEDAPVSQKCPGCVLNAGWSP